MQFLLFYSRLIDSISEKLGRLASIAVIAAALISAGNAFVRYGFNSSSNGWLEIQWYLFGVIVMLGAPIVLQRNEHVRVDILYGRLNAKYKIYVDLLGLVFFLLPVMSLLAYLSWPIFFHALETQEVSPNADGLIRWPALLLLPLGFTWVVLQGLSEIAKRIAHLQKRIELNANYEKPVQ